MTDKPSNPEEKKIIIDEDWKSRVEEEKEALKQQPDQAEAQPEPQPEAQPQGPLPPPSLEFVISSFAMQAMVTMGMIANPVTGKPEVRLPEAKHFIDTIEVLQTKTEGNRTPEETAMLENLLHELRMTYVAVQQKGDAPSS
jgi:hypothetical protein